MIKLAYCDYIAHCIKRTLKGVDQDKQLEVGSVKFDLHPQQGYMLTTKKTIQVSDWQGKKYNVTIEEAND